MSDEPIKIRLKISKARYVVRDMIAAENGNLTATVRMVANSMIDEAGEYMDPDKALAILGELNGEQLDGVLMQFMAELEEAQKKALPLKRGSRS